MSIEKYEPANAGGNRNTLLILPGEIVKLRRYFPAVPGGVTPVLSVEAGKTMNAYPS